MKIPLLCGLAVLVVAGGLSGQEPAEPPPPSDLARTISEASKNFWDSIGFMELTCESFVPDETGERKADTWLTRYDFTWGPDGQCVVVTTIDGPKGIERIMDNRVGLNQRHWIDRSATGEIERATTDVRGNEATYVNDVFELIWVLMPAMEPLHRLIEAGATCEMREIDGEPIAVVRSSFRGNPVEIHCVPAYNYAIRRVRIRDDEHGQGYRVDRFQEINGHWIPAEGRSGKTANDESSWKAFRMTRCALNVNVPSSRFELPELPAGVSHHDQIHGRVERIGEPLAREAAPKPETTPDPAPPPRPDREKILVRDPQPWSLYLALAGAMLVVGGLVILKTRGR